MPKIINLENNILLQIDLINNSLLDIQRSRSSDIENWIPFTFLLEIQEEERYAYDDKSRVAFTLFEIKRLISELQKIIYLKTNNLIFETFEFYNLEAQLRIIINDPLEENQLSFEIWILMGSYTNGQICGFNKGYSFEVSLNVVEKFTNELSDQLDELIVIATSKFPK